MAPDDPQHFARWLAGSGELECDTDAIWKNGDVFPRRRVFGRCVAEHLAPYLGTDAVRHVAAHATAVTRDATGAGWTVHSSVGLVAADAVVLAVTHPRPGIPAALAPVAQAHGFHRRSICSGGSRHDRS